MPTSDHCGIWLKLGNPPSLTYNNYFKFLGPWLDHDDFHVQVHNAWRDSDDWVTNINRLQHILRSWNRDVYGDIFKRKKQLIARMEGIDRKLLEGPNERLRQLKQDLWCQYNSLLDHEEAYWFQQSRSQWLRLGDRNTQYFHQKTIIRRRGNRVDALLDDDGNWLYDEQDIQHVFVSYYQNLFHSAGACSQPLCTSANFPPIDPEVLAGLGAHVTGEEVRRALFSMGNYKAPGPDGFHPLFFKAKMGYS